MLKRDSLGLVSVYLVGRELTEYGIPTFSCVWDGMGYIKEPRLNLHCKYHSQCTMERHQAGQEEALVEVLTETDSLKVIQQPRGGYKRVVALVSVIGLVIVALVAGFFMFTPSCKQVRNTS